MKNSFSDLRRNKYNYCKTISPYSSSYSYLIDTTCFCPCACQIKYKLTKNKKYLGGVTYSLNSKPTNYKTQKIMSLKQIDNNLNNIYFNLNDKNEPKYLSNLNDDLLNQTKILGNEIKMFKEKLLNEKENLSKILNNDNDILDNKINLKNNLYNKIDDYKEIPKIIGFDNEYKNKEIIKKVSLPKKYGKKFKN